MRRASIASSLSLPAALPIASLLPPRPIPALLINGTADPLVPYDGGMGVKGIDFMPVPELARRLAANDGCAPIPMTQAVANWNRFDGCTASIATYGPGVQDSEIVCYIIEGGGHTWPGSRIWLPGFIFGNTCNDFDASQVIWDFFLKHPLPSSIAD